MKTLEQIKKDLKGLTDLESEFENSVICEFEDYEVNGETEVIVENSNAETNVGEYGMCDMWCAYINETSSEVINFAIKKYYENEDDDEFTIKIVEVF
jgi:hypothetical protein